LSDDPSAIDEATREHYAAFYAMQTTKMMIVEFLEK
jgi:hypothetical protein